MSKTIEDVIREKGFYITVPKGTSMFPLLGYKTNDICVVKVDELKKYDVPLYIRDNGEYVLHRIIDISDDGYVCCGDNQLVLERGVRRDQIIGKLDSWYKGDKKHTVRDASYLRYVKIWCRSMGLRRIMLWFCHKYVQLRSIAKAAFRKIFRINKK